MRLVGQAKAQSLFGWVGLHVFQGVYGRSADVESVALLEAGDFEGGDIEQTAKRVLEGIFAGSGGVFERSDIFLVERQVLPVFVHKFPDIHFGGFGVFL